MNSEKKNIPALRFPEFSGSWKSVTLGEYLTFKNGINADKAQYGRGTSFINVLDIINNDTIVHIKIIGKVEISEEEFRKNEVKYGDILFQRSSETREEVGQSNVYLDKAQTATFGGFVIRGQAVREYDPLFFNSLLKTSAARGEITTKSGGSTRFNIGQETLRQVKITLPEIPEQQKIAAFLSAVDEKIGQLSRKKELLTKYKKGVMQQIFDQKIRFKDDNGNDFPDWEEKKLGEVFTFRSTNSFSRDNLNYVDGEVKNIHYGDIHTKFKTLFDITEERVPFINAEISVERIDVDNYCKKGDLIIADASEDYADVGKSIEIVNLNDEKVLAGLHTIHARPDLFEMESGFSGYLMKSRKVRLQIMTIAQGTKVLSISTGRLSKIELDIPSQAEQQKIADFLTAIDKKIDLVNTQLEKTRAFKKGLLQQMFV